MPATPNPDGCLEALVGLTALGRLPRSGWIQAGIPEPESIAAHSLSTALVVLALGPEVEPGIEVDRAVSLAVVHDAPEAELTDLPRSATRWIGEERKREAEGKAARVVLGPLSDLAARRSDEVRSGSTREARFVRLCDRLQLGVQLLAYARAGLRAGAGFRSGLAELDASEFPPCERLRDAILAALAGLEGAGTGGPRP